MKLSLDVGHNELIKQKKGPFSTSLLRRLYCPVLENE